MEILPGIFFFCVCLYYYSSVCFFLAEEEKKIVALKVLCELMAPKNVKESSNLLYNEYEVCMG